MDYYLAKTIANSNLDKVEKLLTEKLKEHGFGIITEIDVMATFKKKLDVDFRPYKILGACNPNYAYKALSKIDKVGVMLPCNVCIQEIGENNVEVFTINPLTTMQPIEAPELEEFAKEVYSNLKAVIDSI